MDPEHAVAGNGGESRAVSNALLRSGFPFQIAVRTAISSLGWRVGEEEFPWRDPSGKDEFLDMVASPPSEAQEVLATIECKKTTKESYIFLLPPENQRRTRRISAVGSRLIADSNPRLMLQVGAYDADPDSVDVDFCVVSSRAGTTERLLEKDAQKLIRGTDAFARAYRDRLTKAQNHLKACLFIPVLITNAQLYVAPFDPAKVVSLTTGTFVNGPPDAKPIDFVRFRKAFVSGARGQPSERTIFVVNVDTLFRILDGTSPIQELTPGDWIRSSVSKLALALLC
jgi:hypothetical protein